MDFQRALFRAILICVLICLSLVNCRPYINPQDPVIQYASIPQAPPVSNNGIPQFIPGPIIDQNSIQNQYPSMSVFWPYPEAQPIALVIDPITRKLVPLETTMRLGPNWMLITDAYTLGLGLSQAGWNGSPIQKPPPQIKHQDDYAFMY